MLIILSICIIFIFRLLYIQVLNKDWAQRAAQISSKIENIQPPRGFIYDRNGKLLVGAEKVYDVYILPNDLRKDDSIKICNLFNLSIEEFRILIEKASSGYNVPYKASLMFESLTKEDHAKTSLQACLGEVTNKLSASELQDMGVLSNCHVNVVQLKETAVYNDYQSELKYLTTNKERMGYLSNFISTVAEAQF